MGNAPEIFQSQATLILRRELGNNKHKTAIRRQNITEFTNNNYYEEQKVDSELTCGNIEKVRMKYMMPPIKSNCQFFFLNFKILPRAICSGSKTIFHKDEKGIITSVILGIILGNKIKRVKIQKKLPCSSLRKKDKRPCSHRKFHITS